MARVRRVDVETGGPLLGGGLSAQALQAGDPLGGGEIEQNLSEEFLLGHVQRAFRLQVGKGDPPFAVHREEAVAHVAQGPAERVAGRPGLVALPAHADHPEGFAVRVVGRPAAGLRPAVRAVQAPHPVLRLVHAVVADRPLRRRQRRREVVGVDDPHPVVDLPGEVGGPGAVELQGGLVPDQVAGADVPVPGADADLLQRLPQPLAGQFRLRGAGRGRGLGHPLLGPGDDGPQEVPLCAGGFALVAHQDGERADDPVSARHRQGGDSGAGPGDVDGVQRRP